MTIHLSQKIKIRNKSSPNALSSGCTLHITPYLFILGNEMDWFNKINV